MIGDKAKAEVAASIECKTFHARIVVRTDSDLVLKRRNASEYKEYLELESGKFHIGYKPRSDQPRFQGKPYVITLPPNTYSRRRYRDWDDFCEECKHDPILNWLKQWSNLSKSFFAMLERNQGLTFCICPDYLKYEKHLRELYKERFGENTDHSLLCEPYEAEAGALAREEYMNRLYDNSIERKIAKGKEKSRKEKENR